MTWRPPWWSWVLVALAVIFCIALSVRVRGFQVLVATQEEARAAGLMTTLEEWVATAPPVDPVGQRDLQAWMRGMSFSDYPPNDGLPLTQSKIQAKEITAARAWADRNRITMERLGPLLANAPLRLGRWGDLPRDASVLRGMSPHDLWTQTTNTLSVTHGTNAWLRIEALRHPDPSPSLSVFDHWWAAQDHPAFLIDLMLAIFSGRSRDETYLWLATRGRLQGHQLHPWSQEPAPYRRWMEEVLAGERLFYGFITRREELFPNAADEVLPLLGLDAPFRGFDFARMDSVLCRWEARLRQTATITERTLPFGLPSIWSQHMLPNMEACLITVVESQHYHRLTRLLALVAAWHHQRGSLPSINDLPPALLQGDDLVPEITYEILGPHRFRLAPAAAAPRPGLIPSDRWPSPGDPGTVGTPPGPWADSEGKFSHRWSRELDLHLLLQAKPPPAVVKPAVEQETPSSAVSF